MLKVWAHALAWRLAHPLGPATTVACKLHGRYGAPKLCWRGRVFMLPANASVRCTWMEYMELSHAAGSSFLAYYEQPPDPTIAPALPDPTIALALD
eukprot:scaffold290905_cov28-Tisochrysis_lutea.AAC.1